MSKALQCEVCTAPLTPETGWFAWFIDKDNVVQHCALTCHMRPKRCCDIVVENQAKLGREERDHHLDHFCGKLALRRFAELVTDYKWHHEATLLKFAEYMLIFARYPGRASEIADLEAG